MDPGLYRAAMEGDVVVLLQYRDQLEVQLTPKENTVLHIAALFGKTKIVKEILRLCPSLSRRLNSQGETPLHIAARGGHSDITKELVDFSGPKTDEEQLENGHCYGGGMPGILRMKNANGDTAVHEAVRNVHLDVVKLLLEEDRQFTYPANKAEETPLYAAAVKGLDEFVAEILRTCTSPTYGGPGGRTALHAAVISGSRECATKLLKWRRSLAKEADERGWTPLHHAACFGHLQMVEEILDLDTSVAYLTTNKDDDRRTALHIAASRGHVDVMKNILSRCPDCWEIDDIKGQNILQIAVKSNKGNVVSFIQTSDILYSLRNQKYDDNTALEPDGPDFMWRRRAEPSETIAHIGCDLQLRNLFMLKKRHLSRFKSLISKNREVRSARHSYGGKSIEEVRKMADTHMIVAALVATVSFTAGLTMPGGYDGNEGPNSGMAMLSRRAAFKGFIVSDTIAMILSVGAIVLYFDAARSYDEEEFQEICNIAGAVVMNALTAMMIAFVTGTYAVLTHSLALASATCVLGSTMAMLTFIYALTYNIREYVSN